MLRKSLNYLKPTKIADSKPTPKEITASDFEYNESPVIPEERDALIAKIDDFCKQLALMQEEKSLVSYDDTEYTHGRVHFDKIKYVKLRIEYGLGIKSYIDCLHEDAAIAHVLRSYIPNNYKNQVMFNIPYGFNIFAAMELETLNERAVAFMRLYKEDLDNPENISFLSKSFYHVEYLDRIVTVFLETPDATEDDITFCTQQFFSFHNLKQEHLKIIFEKLIELRKNGIDINQHRDFVLALLDNAVQNGFEKFEIFKTLDICFLIRQVDALTVDKEVTQARISKDIYQFYMKEIPMLKTHGFDQDADIHFALKQFIRGKTDNPPSQHILYVAESLLSLRTNGLDTIQNRELLFGDRIEHYTISDLLQELAKLAFADNPLKQQYFQRIIGLHWDTYYLSNIISLLNKLTLATMPLFVSLLDKPAYIEPLDDALSHANDNPENIKKILDNIDCISHIAQKLEPYRFKKIPQQEFDDIITEAQDHARLKAFAMSAHPRLGAASPAKKLTTHASYSDPANLTWLISTFFCKTEQTPPETKAGPQQQAKRI